MDNFTKMASNFLSLAGDTFDRSELQWMNRMACRLHGSVVIPFLQRMLPVRSAFLRRSALTPKDFNLFFSDLDLGFMVDDQKDLTALRQSYGRLKKYFPFLGEVEIYEEKEIQELETLLSENNLLYSFFRDLRKVGWMEKRFLATQDGYQRKKYLRAIQKSLKRLGSSTEAVGVGNLSDINLVLANFFEENFRFELAQARSLGHSSRVNITCPYFGRRFIFEPNSRGGPEQRDPSILHMKTELALLTLSLAPPLVREKGQLDGVLSRLRSLPSVKSRLRALTRIEFLIFRSVFRSMEKPSALDLAWLETLSNSDAFLTQKEA